MNVDVRGSVCASKDHCLRGRSHELHFLSTLLISSGYFTVITTSIRDEQLIVVFTFALSSSFLSACLVLHGVR